MGLFRKAIAKVTSKVPSARQAGARDASEGKRGFKVDAFAQAGRNSQKDRKKS